MTTPAGAEATTADAENLAAIREQAAAWILRLDNASHEERQRIQAECEAWQAVDPRRRRVLQQMQQMWSAVDPTRKRRRRNGALGLVLLLGALFAGQLPWQVWTADHRTAPGEIRSLRLPDDSVVVLNSDSAIDVNYSDDRRRIHLLRGELLATVHRDSSQRSFEVATAHGIAAALGTRYGVRLGEDHTIVTVHESRVRLIPHRAEAHSRTLGSGQKARLSADRVSRVESVTDRWPDWTEGRLIFNDVPLAEVVERLGQYRRGWLLLDRDPAADRHFTGVLPATDSDKALALLAQSMSLKVRRVTPYLVWIDTPK